MDSLIFEQLYRDYMKPVFRFLLKLCGDYDLAEELTQETFVKAYEHLENFRGDCSLYVWLCQIGKNACFNHMKKAKPFTSLDTVLEQPSCCDVERRVMDRCTLRDVGLALAELPEINQTVFALHVFSELSYREIGEQLLKSEVWARVTYYRTKKLLQEKLEESDRDEM